MSRDTDLLLIVCPEARQRASRALRAQAAADLLSALFVVACAVWLGYLLVEYVTPCVAGSLCAGAAITPARVGLWLRIRMAFKALYLRRLIASAERDLEFLRHEQEIMPATVEAYRAYLDELRVDLIDCDLAVRTK